MISNWFAYNLAFFPRLIDASDSLSHFFESQPRSKWFKNNRKAQEERIVTIWTHHKMKCTKKKETKNRISLIAIGTKKTCSEAKQQQQHVALKGFNKKKRSIRKWYLCRCYCISPFASFFSILFSKFFYLLFFLVPQHFFLTRRARARKTRNQKEGKIKFINAFEWFFFLLLSLYFFGRRLSLLMLLLRSGIKGLFIVINLLELQAKNVRPFYCSS